jgi:hypothetical protein
LAGEAIDLIADEGLEIGKAVRLAAITCTPPPAMPQLPRPLGAAG